MKFRRPILFACTVLFFGILAINLGGFDDGIINRTKKPNSLNLQIDSMPGCLCHNLSPQPQTTVEILGPSIMGPGDTATFNLIITSSDTGFHAGGTDIAAYFGELYVIAGDTTLQRERDTVWSYDYELTHTDPKLQQNDTVMFPFIYIAPMMDGVYDTIYANGNAVNNDHSQFDDRWNYADNKIIFVTSTSVGNNNGIVNEFKLEQNYPNPFNPSTNINFSVSKASDLSLSVFDLSGKEVAKLIDNKYYSNGDYSIKFETSRYNLSSGVYFYKLSTGDISEIKKMVLIK